MDTAVQLCMKNTTTCSHPCRGDEGGGRGRRKREREEHHPCRGDEGGGKGEGRRGRVREGEGG